ncbi:hypothetical protein MTR_4g116400 [Medicago truncatula]|uniref:Retrotransposon Copia-like N-terminal domain-containing protein n=1 Tax=Medicago truncatula TaxID=3880 RepID=G7JHS2_MEDTR|nr:hypothetical protein MTR_4g116400 [Medicago truncatula]
MNSTFKMESELFYNNENTDSVNHLVPHPQDLSQIPSNVYHVHASNGPSFVAITLVLTHSNQHTSARSTFCSLGAKNKFDFVDGMILVPTHFYFSHKAQTRYNMLGTFMQYMRTIPKYLQ